MTANFVHHSASATDSVEFNRRGIGIGGAVAIRITEHGHLANHVGIGGHIRGAAQRVDLNRNGAAAFEPILHGSARARIGVFAGAVARQRLVPDDCVRREEVVHCDGLLAGRGIATSVLHRVSASDDLRAGALRDIAAGDESLGPRNSPRMVPPWAMN